jgi:hypothetical protein
MKHPPHAAKLNAERLIFVCNEGAKPHVIHRRHALLGIIPLWLSTTAKNSKMRLSTMVLRFCPDFIVFNTTLI